MPVMSPKLGEVLVKTTHSKDIREKDYWDWEEAEI